VNKLKVLSAFENLGIISLMEKAMAEIAQKK